MQPQWRKKTELLSSWQCVLDSISAEGAEELSLHQQQLILASIAETLHIPEALLLSAAESLRFQLLVKEEKQQREKRQSLEQAIVAAPAVFSGFEELLVAVAAEGARRSQQLQLQPSSLEFLLLRCTEIARAIWLLKQISEKQQQRLYGSCMQMFERLASSLERRTLGATAADFPAEGALTRKQPAAVASLDSVSRLLLSASRLKSLGKQSECRSMATFELHQQLLQSQLHNLQVHAADSLLQHGLHAASSQLEAVHASSKEFEKQQQQLLLLVPPQQQGAAVAAAASPSRVCALSCEKAVCTLLRAIYASKVPVFPLLACAVLQRLSIRWREEALQGEHSCGKEQRGAAACGSNGTVRAKASESLQLLRCIDSTFAVLASQQFALHQPCGSQLERPTHPASRLQMWRWFKLRHLAALLRAAEWRLLHAAPAEARGVSCDEAAHAAVLHVFEGAWNSLLQRARYTPTAFGSSNTASASGCNARSSPAAAAAPLPLAAWVCLDAAFRSYRTADREKSRALKLPPTFAAVAAALGESSCSSARGEGAAVTDAAAAFLLQRMHASAAAAKHVTAPAAGVQTPESSLYTVPQEHLLLKLPDPQSTFHAYRLRLRVSSSTAATELTARVSCHLSPQHAAGERRLASAWNVFSEDYLGIRSFQGSTGRKTLRWSTLCATGQACVGCIEGQSCFASGSSLKAFSCVGYSRALETFYADTNIPIAFLAWLAVGPSPVSSRVTLSASLSSWQEARGPLDLPRNQQQTGCVYFTP
ncbi:hypothetical protein cyc_03675 [Cyclospora cayetanensis]|uniref:Uncharacterized protein n=1 Tax=Cyclospora cayetanensis TaxID=88456 RepID=A0A1D3CUY5_9EIME|nr:hypothetical protein cyc_03675 [Cyclospora cayetanensis]